MLSAYTLKSLIHNVSNNNPNVLKSFIKSFGPIPNEATAIDGSIKYLVSDVLIAVLLLKFGFQAGDSSSTNIFFNAFTYDNTVSVSREVESLAIISLLNVSFDA